MARDVESLVLRMSADLRRFEKSMDSMRATADRRLNDVEKRAALSQRRMTASMDQAGKGMVGALRSSLGALAPTLATAFSAGAVLRYADAYTSLQNRLKAAGLEGEALRRTEGALYEAANRNGVAVAATAELYQRAAMARQNLGATEEQLLALVSGTTAALRLQGTSATEASGALLQLGQILGGDKVQAQEYNSLIDQLPVLLQAAADGSGRFGGQINVLTKEVKAGNVTTQEFFAALLKGLTDVEAKAASATPTLAGAFQTLNNELGKYIGQADANLSATARMAQGIEALSRNLDNIIPILGVLIGLVGSRYVLALTASTGATVANAVATARLIQFQTAMTASMTGTTTATVVATGAMARFNAMVAANPLGVAVVAVAALSGAIVLLGNRLAITGQATRDVKVANDALKAATDAYAEAANAAAIATGASAQSAREDAAAKRAQAIATRDAAQAKLADAAATVAQIQAEAQRQLDLERRAPIRGDRPGSVRTIGRGARQTLANASASASEASAAVRSANAAIAAADAALRRRAPSTPAVTSGGSGGRGGGSRGSGAAGPNPEDLARQRQLLALQMDVERLRAEGREAEATARQREIDTINLARQLSEAGVQDAQAVAEAHTGAVAEAERRAEGFAKWVKASADFWDQIGEDAAAAAEAERLLSDQTRDRLGYEAELARLTGSEGAIRNAERQLFIHERTLEILRLQLATTKEQAAAMAGAEWEQLDRAEGGRDMARSIVDVLRSDNIWEEAGRRFKDAAWDGIEQLLSQLFAGMNGGGQGGGGNWLSAIASMFTGGRKAATGRAGVTPGYPILTGERRAEVFVPKVAGSIIPSVNAAMNRAQATRTVQAAPVVRLFVEEGAMFAPRVAEVSGPIALQTAATGVSYTQHQARTAASRRRQSFVG